MEYYIALDGGGSKLSGLLFNSEYQMISHAVAGGINQNIYSQVQVKEHIETCISQLFQKADVRIQRIEQIFAAWNADYRIAVERHCPCGEMVRLGEGYLGVLACGMTSGICALSGTGSDIFYIRDGKELDAIGGWGYLLGDIGSGIWIGRQALRSMLNYMEGGEPETYLHQLIKEKYHPACPSDMSQVIYSATSPPYKLGTFCKIVNQAAEQGDPNAKGILTRGGIMLAQSVEKMVKKHQISGETAICTTGSVFRYCTDLCSAFDLYIGEHLPEYTLHHAIFEPIIGCVIHKLIEKQGCLDARANAFLKEEYRLFI